jgi:hypothetical protein
MGMVSSQILVVWNYIILEHLHLRHLADALKTQELLKCELLMEKGGG